MSDEKILLTDFDEYFGSLLQRELQNGMEQEQSQKMKEKVLDMKRRVWVCVVMRFCWFISFTRFILVFLSSLLLGYQSYRLL